MPRGCPRGIVPGLEAGMNKFDPKKTLKHLYSAPADRFVIVYVPRLSYFMIDGEGNPNTAPRFQEAVEALYSASYTLKFLCKKEVGIDYVVPPLEGIWHAEDMTTFITRRKDDWRWTLMIMIPDEVPAGMADRAIAAAAKKAALPGLAKLRVAALEEGRSVQILHLGSFDAEGPVIERLHREFLPANRLVETGHHHEIYLSDARRTAPEKLKTILRQPVGPA
jgi:hypothetical protein